MRAVLLVAVVLAGCGGGGGDDVPGDDVPGDDAGSTAVELQQLASAIYDAVEADAGAGAAPGDLAFYMEGVFLAMDVAVLAEPDAELASRFAAGRPFLFEPQMNELADAFVDGGLVSLDGLIAAVTERGVTGPGGAPLDRATFDAGFFPLLLKQDYTRAEVMPALVLALARERAARHGGSDPLWGDGMLDPLQTTLLMYAFSYGDATRVVPPASAKPAVFSSETVINFVRDHAQGQVEGHVLGWVEIPTGADEDAAIAILCSSLQLYGHKMKVTADPDLIWHQREGVPFSTTVTAVLTFEDDWWDNRAPIDQWLFNELPGCELPRRGPVPEKPLEWSVSDGLEGHGQFNFAQSATNDAGTGVGYWVAVLETTPPEDRVFMNQRDAVGSAIIRATSLVPGWSTLERAVGFLKDTGNHGDDPLTVMYYVGSCAGSLWNGAPGPGQCVDEWHGSAEETFDVPGEGGYHIVGEGLTWTPVVTGGGETIYELSAGTVSIEMWMTGCEVSVNPPNTAFVGNPNAISSLDVMWETDPKRFSGSASILWLAAVTRLCEGEDPSVNMEYVGGQFFRANQDTPFTGDVLADNYNLLEYYQYEFSFHR